MHALGLMMVDLGVKVDLPAGVAALERGVVRKGSRALDRALAFAACAACAACAAFAAFAASSQQAVQRSGAIQIGPQHVEARLPSSGLARYARLVLQQRWLSTHAQKLVRGRGQAPEVNLRKVSPSP